MAVLDCENKENRESSKGRRRVDGGRQQHAILSVTMYTKRDSGARAHDAPLFTEQQSFSQASKHYAA